MGTWLVDEEPIGQEGRNALCRARSIQIFAENIAIGIYCRSLLAHLLTGTFAMKQIRQLHLYLGTFFAPAIFFFALSGALQTFSLHESEDGSSYSPPSWIVTIASIHKDQRLSKPHHHEHAAPAEAAPEQAKAAAQDGHVASVPAAHEEEHEAGPSTLPLKIFVLLLAVGLMLTAALGIYMALQSRNNRRMTWVMLACGILVPVAMLFL
jgi:hypothetical protein